jgi:hypothetical protein
MLVVEVNTTLYTIWSPLCKGVSLESARGANWMVDHVYKELHHVDVGGRRHPPDTSKEGESKASERGFSYSLYFELSTNE